MRPVLTSDVIPPRLADLLERQRSMLAGVQDQYALARLGPLLLEAEAELKGRLARVLGGGAGGRSFSAHRLRAALVQVDAALLRLAPRLSGLIGRAAAAAIRRSIADVSADVRASAPEFLMAETPIDYDLASRALGERDPTLLHRIEAERVARAGAAAAHYTESERALVARELARSLVLSETCHEAMKRVIGKAGPLARSYQAERIVRTEMSFAYNSAASSSLSELAAGDNGLWLMWHEHAEGPIWGGPQDLPWPGPAQPLDQRTADDSLRLHGQCRRPGQLFVDPETGEEFPHPPNRPNDRAALVLVRLPEGGARTSAPGARAAGQARPEKASRSAGNAA